MSDLKEDLLERINYLQVFKTGEFTLASGAKSNFYIDGRLITLDPVGVEIISKIILNNFDKSITTIGGPATAAIPIVSSLLLVSNILFKRKLKGFYVRPSAKEHGLSNSIEGLLSQKDKVIIVDDTITSGSSLINAIKEVEKQGCKVVQTFVVFDRGEGGPENLENAGYKINSIFKYDHKENKLI